MAGVTDVTDAHLLRKPPRRDDWMLTFFSDLWYGLNKTIKSPTNYKLVIIRDYK